MWEKLAKQIVYEMEIWFLIILDDERCDYIVIIGCILKHDPKLGFQAQLKLDSVSVRHPTNGLRSDSIT